MLNVLKIESSCQSDFSTKLKGRCGQKQHPSVLKQSIFLIELHKLDYIAQMMWLENTFLYNKPHHPYSHIPLESKGQKKAEVDLKNFFFTYLWK